MEEEMNLSAQYKIPFNEKSTLLEGLEDAGKNQKGDKPVSWNTITKNPKTTSEFITSEIPLPNTSEFNIHNTNEASVPNINENQPPNLSNISEKSNTTVDIGELSDINFNEIGIIRIKDKNFFKSGAKISDFLNNINNNYNNENFNNCRNCNGNNPNAFYCTLCHNNLCQQCRDNNERCHHQVINLLELKNGISQVKYKIYKLFYEILFKLKQEQPKEKSDKIYDAKDLNIDINKRMIDDDIENFKEQNDFKLIKAIIKYNYINYFHFQNILECKNYLVNRYQKCLGKHCLIINYNTQGVHIRDEIIIFGEYFVAKNRDEFFLIINNKHSDHLISNTVIEDNYLEVILVKKTDNLIEDLSSMFEDCNRLENFSEYKGHKIIDFKDVKYINSMFKGCTRLRELDLKFFGGSAKDKLQSMVCTFSECSNLQQIQNIDLLDTTNVETMASLFNRCLALTNINGIQNFKTENVTDFSEMFCRCENLSIPDIGKWNMEKAQNLSGMFQECKRMIEFPFISKWTINNVITMKGMFYGCIALTLSPDFSGWDMRNLNNIEEMFRGCVVMRTFPKYKSWKNFQRRVRTTGIFDGCPNYHN